MPGDVLRAVGAEVAMTLLQPLHGTIAAILLCALLFADEVGLPLPVAPNELVLIVAGVLADSDAFSPWVFFPIAAAVSAGGMIVGYSWSRAAGERTLRRLAERFGAGGAYARVRRRVTSAGPVTIGVLRLIPGVRPWATLISGAAGVPPRRFLAGALPALAIWVGGLGALGVLVGLPAEHFLGEFEKLAVRGALLLVLAVAAGLVLRLTTVRAGWRERLSPALVGCVQMTIAAATTAGLLALVRSWLHAGARGWIDGAVIAAAVLLSWLAGPVRRRRHPPVPRGRAGAAGHARSPETG